jgi:hypothetical protein
MIGRCQTAIRGIFELPCRFPAAPSIRPESRVQGFDQKRLFDEGRTAKKIYPEFPCAAGKGRGGPTRLERADGLRNREPAICHASTDCKKRRRLVAPVCQEHLQTSLVSGSSRSEFPCPSVISSAESGQTASRRSMAAASMFSGSRRLVPDLRPLTCHMAPLYRLGIFGGN